MDSNSSKLILLIKNTEFEYGKNNEIDLFIKKIFKLYPLVASNWLKDIFFNNLSEPFIIVGLLRIISRLNYNKMKLDGELIIEKSFLHSNIEVQECAIRVIENWEHENGLKILENNLKNIKSKWVKEYAKQVIIDLKEDLS